jgi:hypothetical protein
MWLNPAALLSGGAVTAEPSFVSPRRTVCRAVPSVSELRLLGFDLERSAIVSGSLLHGC